MITKGIIEEVVSPFKARVRLPVYHGIRSSDYATETKDLPTATLCALPNCTYAMNVGDVVYCGVEDNDFSKPVILGFLYKQDKAKTSVDLSVNSISVVTDANFPDDTKIGSISPQSIQNLSGVKRNVQNQIDDVENDATLKYKSLNDLVSGIKNSYVDKTSDQVIGGQKDFEVNPRVKVKGDSPREGLPDAYVQLQYVESVVGSNGTFPYIDTGYVINTETDTVELVFELDDTIRYRWIFGEHDIDARFGIGVGDGVVNQRNVAYGGATNKVPDNLFYGKLHYFKADSTGVFIDDTNKVANHIDFASTSTIALFCLNNNGFTAGASGKIQSYKHVQDGTTVMDLISVKRKSDNKPGFYNFANNSFIVSSSSVDLIAGPELAEDHYEPLLSDADVIDFLTSITGYNPNVTQTLKHNNNGLLWVND